MQDRDNNLTAILGPTNTGKTYTAFERLISYKSGIFGFPLRLLARENYDKAASKLGTTKVALIRSIAVEMFGARFSPHETSLWSPPT